jgi:hypothetical protein
MNDVGCWDTTLRTIDAVDLCSRQGPINGGPNDRRSRSVQPSRKYVMLPINECWDVRLGRGWIASYPWAPKARLPWYIYAYRGSAFSFFWISRSIHYWWAPSGANAVYRWELNSVISWSFGCGRFGSVRCNWIYFGRGGGRLGLFLLRSAFSRLSFSPLSLPLSALTHCVLDEAIVFSRVDLKIIDMDVRKRRGWFLRFEPWFHRSSGTTRRFLAESIQ